MRNGEMFYSAVFQEFAGLIVDLPFIVLFFGSVWRIPRTLYLFYALVRGIHKMKKYFEGESEVLSLVFFLGKAGRTSKANDYQKSVSGVFARCTICSISTDDTANSQSLCAVSEVQ
jgi:hypothetical protein